MLHPLQPRRPPAPQEGEQLAHDVVAEGRVGRVARVGEGVGLVETVTVLDPHPPDAHAGVDVEHSGQGHLATHAAGHGDGRRAVPCQASVVVAGEDDDPAILSPREGDERGGQAGVGGEGGAGVGHVLGQQLHHVAGQHDHPWPRHRPDGLGQLGRGRRRCPGGDGSEMEVAGDEHPAPCADGHVHHVGNARSARSRVDCRVDLAPRHEPSVQRRGERRMRGTAAGRSCSHAALICAPVASGREDPCRRGRAQDGGAPPTGVGERRLCGGRGGGRRQRPAGGRGRRP